MIAVVIAVRLELTLPAAQAFACEIAHVATVVQLTLFPPQRSEGPRDTLRSHDRYGGFCHTRLSRPLENHRRLSATSAGAHARAPTTVQRYGSGVLARLRSVTRRGRAITAWRAAAPSHRSVRAAHCWPTLTTQSAVTRSLESS